MRRMLVDWMMEVSEEFAFKRETFHLSVFFVDRYLSIQADFQLDSFQLLGTAALFSASKIEEIYPPKVKCFEQATDCGFSEEDILKMESLLL